MMQYSGWEAVQREMQVEKSVADNQEQGSWFDVQRYWTRFLVFRDDTFSLKIGCIKKDFAVNEIRVFTSSAGHAANEYKYSH